MAITTTGVNSPQAVKRWAMGLAMDVDTKSYFGRKYIGTGMNNIIERKLDLEDDAGDEIRFDLSMRLRGEMTYGDDIVEGKEDQLSFYQDTVKIDQARKGASAGGRMTRKRTLHDYRKLARELTGIYIAEWQDDGFFVYLSGASGTGAAAPINEDNKFTNAFAGNPIQAPDADHIIYAGAATSKATVAATDKMTVNLIERVAVKARMMNSVNPDVVAMTPVNIEGGNYFILLMSPFNEFDLRTETGEAGWIRYQQAAAAAEGRNNPLFKGNVGMIANTVLHSHERVRRFSDYGAGSNVAASRSLFLGRQAGVVAYGAAGNGSRMTWVEKMTDADNQVAIYCGVIMGMKKTRFNNRDFGVISIDAAAKNPG